MAQKKKYSYTVAVEDTGTRDVFFNIKADTYQEAAEKAKKRFMKLYWNKRKLSASMCDKSENLF